MRSSVKVLLVIPLVVVALAGCGGSKRTPEDAGAKLGLPTGSADPCRFATTAEVAKAVKHAVKAPLRSSVKVETGQVLSCTWPATGTDPTVAARLDVFETAAPYDAARKAQASAPLVPGLGTEAFVGQLNTIWVRESDGSYSATWSDQNPAHATQAAAASLAFAKLINSNWNGTGSPGSTGTATPAGTATP